MVPSDPTKHSSADATRPTGMSIEDWLEFSDETVIKCYKCYSKDVRAICHHCGRLLCEKCQCNPLGSLHTDNVFARMHTLPNIFKQSAHCKDCFHYEDTIARLIVPSLLMMVAILVLLPPIAQFAWQQTTIWTALAPPAPWGAGALALLILAWLTWRLYPRLPFPVKYPLGVPVFPRYAIELEEHLIAHFDIAPGRYLLHRIPRRSQLTVKLRLVPEDAERCRSAPKPKLHDGKVTLYAGFVALDKQKNVRFPKMKQHLGNDLTFPITEEIAPDEFIKLCRERQPIEWVRRYRIEPEALRLGPKYDKEFPLFIKPRLLPGGLRLELMLELHKDVTGKVMLDCLTLKAPPVFCGVEGAKPTTPTTVEDTDGQFDPSKGQVAWRRKKVATDAPLVLYIEFQPSLSAQPWRFEGEYKLTIEGFTLSGLRVGEDPHVKGQSTETGKYIIIRPASGNRVGTEEVRWMDPTVKHKTTIEGKVAFETSTFLAYSIHTEPKAPEQPEECYCVSPNHKIIDAIIAALTDPREPNQPQVYIQQVVEALGHVTEAGIGGKQARCWEIKGRYYIGLHETHEEGAKRDRPSSPRIPKEQATSNQAITSNPSTGSENPPPQPHDPLTGQLQPIDVHLVIRGEESRDHSESGQDTLCFELVLRSVVSNGNQETADPQEYYEVSREIEEDYQVLKRVIGRTIREKGNQL